MFLLTFSTLKSVAYFLVAFGTFRIADILWIWRIKKEHKIPPDDLVFINTWFFYDFVEVFIVVGLYLFVRYNTPTPLMILIVFMCARIITRILESKSYKKVFYAV